MAYEDIALRRSLRELFPDLQYYGLDRMTRLLTLLAASLNSVGVVVWCYVSWKLYFRLGWRIYVYNGANTVVKRLVSILNIFQVLLKIDVLFLILVSIFFIFLVVIPQLFFVMATDTIFLVFFLGGTGMLYSLGVNAIEFRSTATMTLFCTTSCVEFLATVLCLYSLMTGTVGSNPSVWERKVQIVMLVAGCVCIAALVVTAVAGAYNAYLFTVYPEVPITRKKSSKKTVEWSLV
ncbi:hypothetical protein M427DRAFT_72188 [Gonapodya prolifera JEL478]|uniref:Uncharacterized protein n=1 Tax=Gonapodya prolifera (strain JEL478) TaxID=1344416 RepID=A0A139A639_GONPJ|nr:hypothetical protein M427DRAFT_72188 [Gonapodya prolifera JEL478]|eukprot:KXS12221.1 hypothetical protein M427DRAFT_72188 [Gonapodya prolifera JEL478]